MDDKLTFLPWLRRGLAQALTTVDPLSGPIARGAAITASVDVLDAHAARTIRLHGPDRVTGLAPGQILRSEPRPDSVDVEPTFFPYVELAAPDLPWMYTPAAPDPEGERLRPWLVLVVVREQDGVTLDTPAGGPPTLRIDAALAAGELPDLADSWAWVHVQSLVGVDGAAAAVTGATGEVVARLLCPRRLLPDSSWLACVVPAFVDDGSSLAPAWEPGGAVSPLPVYHHWRFNTGPAGSFEELCRRLEPDDSGVEFGLYPMDVTDPGLVEPAGETVLLDYEGALQTLGARPRAWKRRHRLDFQGELEPLLNASAIRADFDPRVREPVVGPPLYGQWPAGQRSVQDGWLRELNLDPVRRAAAGLGARVVRATQEELVAGAWEQAGSLRAAMAALNQGRLAVEVGRVLTARTAALSGGDALHLTAPLHALLGTPAKSIGAELAASAVPTGLVTSTHLRLTRPGTPLARDWPGTRLAPDHVETTVAATGGDGKIAALEFAAYELVDGAQVRDPTLHFEASLPAFLRARQPEIVDPDPIDMPDTVPIPTGGGADVSAIAADVIAALDPLAAVRASVLARMPALAEMVAADTLPTTLAIGPRFHTALYEDLVALGADLLMPGAGEFPRNRVRLVETNRLVVGAFLIGANHELARELLWRDYPVDLRATFFDRFWDYVDEGDADIGELADWTLGHSLAQNLSETAQVMTVMVVRGDLVRRYPTAHYFLQKARIDADSGEIEPVPGEVEPAILRGAIDAETLFVGFGLDSRVVVGDRAGGGDPGWLFAIEEQPAAPRFGLDDPEPDADYGVPPASWNDVSWASVAKSPGQLAGLVHAPVDVEWLAGAAIPGATWGHNAAHMARATWQRPFRMFIPADQLI